MTGFTGPAVDEALGWLERALAPTGLLPYAGSARGLVHQGWRDATVARGAGRRRRLAGRARGRPAGRGRLGPGVRVCGPARPRPARGRGRRSPIASTPPSTAVAGLAVDGRGAAVDTLASEIGIVLWVGLLRPGRVEGAVAGLEEVATPWGLRTVNTGHARFDPYAYHYGAIWPFENWFAWSGLRVAGVGQAAARVRRIGRMPECYAVEVRGSAPLILPRANRTQAWTAGGGVGAGGGLGRPPGRRREPNDDRYAWLSRPDSRRTWELATGGGGDDSS